MLNVKPLIPHHYITYISESTSLAIQVLSYELNTAKIVDIVGCGICRRTKMVDIVGCSIL